MVGFMTISEDITSYLEIITIITIAIVTIMYVPIVSE